MNRLEDLPLLWLGLAAAAAVVLLLLLLAQNRTARAIRQNLEPLGWQLNHMNQRVQSLSDVQQQLAGGLAQVAEAQLQAQGHFSRVMEQRLAEVAEGMGDALEGSALRTARSLGDLHARLQVIDKAQERIEQLSGNVLGLQDILSNKQARGAFGEIQLHDIISRALPPDAYKMQATLSNGRRADCLIDLPNPPGPLAIDAKFPLEPYEALRRASNESETQEARRQMRAAIRNHIRAISTHYILQGETAEGAMMFIPSEAVYAELHGNFPELVREAFDARVWIVSPTTCMATLNTLRAVLKDVRLREQTALIRRELTELTRDLERMGTRMDALDRHFGQSARDLAELRISTDKASRRAQRLDSFDFASEPEPKAPPPPPSAGPLTTSRIFQTR